jgi:hypothetical protein
MATIITVHGTGASGPEEGNKWWQKGSAFEMHIRELVEGANGTALNTQRLIWDGANSEKSRQKAAINLHERVKTLESKGEKYCMIGHSHGGSVIASTLLLAAAKRNGLAHLAQLITVGTPFIQSVKAFWLFSRSGLIGKSVIVSVAMFILFLMLPPLISEYSEDDPIAWPLAVALIFGIPFSLIYSILWALNGKKFFMYRQKVLTFAATTYSHRVVSIHHKNDEAINGMRCLKDIQVRIFQRNFAVSLFSFLSIFLLPLLVITIAASQSLLTRFAKITDYGIEPKDEGFVWNLFYVTDMISEIIPGWILFVVPASLGLTYLVGIASIFISGLLSAGLNRLTWQQIRKVGFGNDTNGELAIDASSSCMWLSSISYPLPERLAGEISDLSNRAASVAVEKFRGMISELALSKEREANTFLFAEYLTWDELIHCSYFNVPRFRMLVAYAIAQSEGFRPTEIFKSHPDYELVAQWYEEIRPKADATPLGDKAGPP